MTTTTCKRCGGTGTIEAFDHNIDGHCFACLGTGRTLRKPAETKVVTVGTTTITLTDNRTAYAVLIQNPNTDSIRKDFEDLAEARAFANAAYKAAKEA